MWCEINVELKFDNKDGNGIFKDTEDYLTKN